MSSGDPLRDDSHSVTRLIARLRDDDPDTAGEIWRRYFERLLPLARAKLQALPHRVVDEEDVLVSVFDRFFRAAQQERFARLQSRNDLWQILLMLTERKVADQYRAAATHKRGGKLACESSSESLRELDSLPDDEPRPEFVVTFNDQLSRALERLEDPTTREVALLRMEGYENREIADRLEIGLSSVERKLRVIREVWQSEFA
jgi:DNA-directed RNA polymerase specialized sigma24 family protein